METTQELQVGQFVLSKAGRDKKRIFVILAIENTSFILVADGALRKAVKPKRKKVRHVTLIKKVSEVIQEKIAAGVCVQDDLLRSEIEKLTLEQARLGGPVNG